MAFRYLVPALAIAQGAAAACSGTTTVSNAADASALSTCLTYSGDIAIATSTSDEIALDGIRRIDGNLIMQHNHKITSLSADSLSQIDDTFFLGDIQILTNLNFPALTSVDIIDWSGLPSLQGLSFTAGVQQASTLSIQNTNLYSLDGINLEIIDTLIIANNFFLNDITMQLGNVSNSLRVESNGRDVRLELPNLIWANNMTLRNVSDLNIDSLASVNGTLGFYSNFFEELSAPNLTTIGKTLAIVSNGMLTNVSMPELKSIGGALQVANNTHYTKIDSFDRLTQVGGAVDMYGTFSEVSLPDIKTVQGDFNLQSTKDISSTCNHFRKLSGPTLSLRGQFTCAGGQENAGGRTNLEGGSSGGGSSSGVRSMAISGAAGILGIVAAIFGML